MAKIILSEDEKIQFEEDAKYYRQNRKKDRPIFSIDNVPSQISDIGID